MRACPKAQIRTPGAVLVVSRRVHRSGGEGMTQQCRHGRMTLYSGVCKLANTQGTSFVGKDHLRSSRRVCASIRPVRASASRRRQGRRHPGSVLGVVGSSPRGRGAARWREASLRSMWCQRPPQRANGVAVAGFSAEVGPRMMAREAPARAGDPGGPSVIAEAFLPDCPILAIPTVLNWARCRARRDCGHHCAAPAPRQVLVGWLVWVGIGSACSVARSPFSFGRASCSGRAWASRAPSASPPCWERRCAVRGRAFSSRLERLCPHAVALVFLRWGRRLIAPALGTHTAVFPKSWTSARSALCSDSW